MKFPVDPRLPIVDSSLTYLQRLNQRLYDLFRDIAKSLNLISDGFILTVTEVTGNYTATTADQLLLVDNTTGITVTLPDASESKDKRFIIKKVSNNTFPVTVAASAGNIDDDASVIIDVAYTSLDFVSDGTNYWIV